MNNKDLKTYKGTKEDLHNQGTSYREVINKSAEENDVDGGVHMEDFDDNKKEHQSIWIIHNPNQIKSATDNNGDFSTLNDDIQMAINNKNNNSTINRYETYRRTEENQQFPEILGNARKEKEASRTMAAAADDSRRSQPNDGKQEGLLTEKFLAYLEGKAHQQETWIDGISSLGTLLNRKGGAENVSKDGKSYIKLNRFTMLDVLMQS